MATALYIALIALVNFGFENVPLVQMPGGEMWPPMSLAVGFVFVVRDFAQREIGHGVLLAMLAGAALSWWMASPFVAVASASAFLISELADWGVYTWTRKPLGQRILISSAIGTPVDSVVFLAMIGHLSLTGVVVMTASKMLGALVVVLSIRRRWCWGIHRYGPDLGTIYSVRRYCVRCGRPHGGNGISVGPS